MTCVALGLYEPAPLTSVNVM